MASNKTILLFLSQKVVHGYCPHLVQRMPLSQWTCRDQLIPAIGDKMKIRYDLLPCDYVFYQALRANEYSLDMLEKLAVFYYLMQEGEDKEALIKYYLEIAKQQRRQSTPYWLRFVEEYKKEQKAKKKRPFFPRNIQRWLIAIGTKKCKALERAMKKRGRERKRTQKEKGRTIKK